MSQKNAALQIKIRYEKDSYEIMPLHDHQHGSNSISTTRQNGRESKNAHRTSLQCSAVSR